MNGVAFIRTCRCAGSDCGGHPLGPAVITLTGHQGAVQHTYTSACDGFHESGPCPKRQQWTPFAVHIGREK